MSGKRCAPRGTYSVVPVLLALVLILVAAIIALRQDLLTPHAIVVVVQTSAVGVLAPASARQTVHATLVLVVLVSSILRSLLILPATLDCLVSSATSGVLLEALIPELLLDSTSAVRLLVVASLEATLK